MRWGLIAGSTFALCGAGLLAGQASSVSPGYDHFYNLEYDEALAEFSTAAAAHPDDPVAWNHIAHVILYRALYRCGALESELVSGSNPFLRRDKVKITPSDDATFRDAVNRAITLSQQRLAQQPDDPDALEALGIAYGIRGNYDFLVRKAWSDALHDATDARNAHKRLCDLQPDNIDARLIPAVYDYVIGSLPIGYRILGFIAGYHGNRVRGIEMLASVAKEAKKNRADAEILLSAIYRREHHPEQALPLLDDLTGHFPRNYLLRFEIVQMDSDAGKKEAALAEINRIRELQQTQAPGFAALPPEKVDYLEADFLFRNDDLDLALTRLKRVTAKARELDVNTALMSWMRTGQIYDLQGRHAAATLAYRKVIAMAPLSQAGKEARAYMGKPYRKAKTTEPDSASRKEVAAHP